MNIVVDGINFDENLLIFCFFLFNKIIEFFILEVFKDFF